MGPCRCERAAAALPWVVPPARPALHLLLPSGLEPVGTPLLARARAAAPAAKIGKSPVAAVAPRRSVRTLASPSDSFAVASARRAPPPLAVAPPRPGDAAPRVEAVEAARRAASARAASDSLRSVQPLAGAGALSVPRALRPPPGSPLPSWCCRGCCTVASCGAWPPPRMAPERRQRAAPCEPPVALDVLQLVRKPISREPRAPRGSWTPSSSRRTPRTASTLLPPIGVPPRAHSSEFRQCGGRGGAGGS